MEEKERGREFGRRDYILLGLPHSESLPTTDNLQTLPAAMLAMDEGEWIASECNSHER
jgi:hypothetical protein